MFLFKIERIYLLHKYDIFFVSLEATIALEPVIDDLKGDLKETFETYNELFYACQEKIRKQNEMCQVRNLNISFILD